MRCNVIIVVIVAVAAPIVALSISRGREFSKRNMHAMAHIGKGDAKDSLICPSSGLQHGNYLIVALPAPPIDTRTVVMYEPKSNHGDGGNFLLLDCVCCGDDLTGNESGKCPKGSERA